jgi:hypothetical protein
MEFSMEISTIMQTVAIKNNQISEKIQQPLINKVTVNDSGNNSATKVVNMRNVSLNEINELIKSGVDGLLDIVPYNPSQNVRYAGTDNAGSIKIDYISHVENQIKFQKSIGGDVAFLEKVLANIKEINGMEMPTKINLKV